MLYNSVPLQCLQEEEKNTTFSYLMCTNFCLNTRVKVDMLTVIKHYTQYIVLGLPAAGSAAVCSQSSSNAVDNVIYGDNFVRFTCKASGQLRSCVRREQLQFLPAS